MNNSYINKIKERPVLTYYFLTFLISWGSIAILGLIYGNPTASSVFQNKGPILMIPFLFGPFISSLLLTGLIDGRNGYKQLLSRLKPNAGYKWYAIAILFIPLLVMVLLGLLSLINPSFFPSIFSEKNKLELVMEGLVIGFFGGGLFEEIGWTGFVLPRLQQYHKPTFCGIFIGLLWALWHIYPTYFGSGDINGILSLDLFIPPLVFYITVLPAYRVLMVWLFVKTKSIIVTMIAHMSLTANTIFILTPDVSGSMLTLYYLILAAILWLIIALNNRRMGLIHL